MAKPIGHTLIGMALARRMGVDSPVALAAAGIAANLPDLDVIPGLVRYGDPWRYHRQRTHTPGFALTAGMLAGFAGIVSAGSAEGQRDLIADSFVGAAVVGSHLVLDRLPFPYLGIKKRTPFVTMVRNMTVNWLLDAAFYGAVAWAVWPRPRQA